MELNVVERAARGAKKPSAREKPTDNGRVHAVHTKPSLAMVETLALGFAIIISRGR